MDSPDVALWADNLATFRKGLFLQGYSKLTCHLVVYMPGCSVGAVIYIYQVCGYFSMFARKTGKRIEMV